MASSLRGTLGTRLFWPRFIKRWLPTSLFGRSLLIIVLPIALMQIAVIYLFFDNHWRIETRRLSDALAGDVAWVVASDQKDPSPAAFARLTEDAGRYMRLSVALQPHGALPISKRRPLFPSQDWTLKRALEGRLRQPFWFETARFPAYIDIRVQVGQGVLRIIAPRERAFATQVHIFILWMIVATVGLTAVSLAFIRNQVRAIERLAEAAEAFGLGGDVPLFKPHGAREVRKAAHAFIAMKERIQRHIDQRTEFLAAVSHDLRTPLTRLKLEAALAEPSPQVAEMKRDLAEMEHMIDEYLAFARGQGGEGVETVPLRGPILEIGASAARAGVALTINVDDALSGGIRPNGFKRALSNLIMNAAAHADQIEVTARAAAAGGVEILIDDDGPGIAPELYEEAFRPFSRLDVARNQNEKGVGLGLAVARDFARSVGGDVTLERSPLGGLRAVMRLPG
jgi:two-component system osmolarity sensor histidine kinase EnvZ